MVFVLSLEQDRPNNTHTNGVAESTSRGLMYTARSMVARKNVENRFWTEALEHAVYVYSLQPFSCEITLSWFYSISSLGKQITKDNKPSSSWIKMLVCSPQS